jgi:hypothetical protein
MSRRVSAQSANNARPLPQPPIDTNPQNAPGSPEVQLRRRERSASIDRPKKQALNRTASPDNNGNRPSTSAKFPSTSDMNRKSEIQQKISALEEKISVAAHTGEPLPLPQKRPAGSINQLIHPNPNCKQKHSL